VLIPRVQNHQLCNQKRNKLSKLAFFASFDNFNVPLQNERSDKKKGI
jgi:hypothetical protein